MTDNEIIKALDVCTTIKTSEACDYCPYKGLCREDSDVLEKDALSLILRQKAEIAMLQKAIQVQEIMLNNQEYTIKRAKAEAYKEFAERYKEQIFNFTGMFTDNDFMVSSNAVLDSVDFIKEKLIETLSIDT